jgi:hypothetical protein
MMSLGVIQPAKSSPAPASIELQSPEQVTLSASPSVPSVQQPATTLSVEHPPLALPIAPPTLTTSRAQAALSVLADPKAPSRLEQLWDRAYNDLKADKHKLLNLYKANTI